MAENKKLKLLFIDDDTFIADMYALKFSHAGHELVSAYSVDEALNILRKGNDFDVIATDLIMPDKDGFDFLRIAKEEKLLGDSVIVVLSNQDSPEVRKTFKELGAVKLIVKAHALPNEVLKIIEDTVREYKGKK